MNVQPNPLALFLDFDGTLVDIAPTPQAIERPPQLRQTLAALHHLLDGALACISGRTYRDVAQQLGGVNIPIVGSHGAEFLQPAPSSPRLQAFTELCRRTLAAWPQAVVEPKPLGLALHWRQAPEAEPMIRQLGERLLAQAPDLRLCEGKKVLELLPQGANKGSALRRLMEQPPFQGRMPVFIGDDFTDIPALLAAQALGGHAFAVGDRIEQVPDGRFASPHEVRSWLQEWAVQAALPLPPSLENI